MSKRTEMIEARIVELKLLSDKMHKAFNSEYYADSPDHIDDEIEFLQSLLEVSDDE